jgi:site-specific recombinase XerD
MVSESVERDWCESFKSSKLWLTAVQADKSGSVHTRKSYCKGLKTFSDWVGKNPDQLIAERRIELKNEETEMNAENKLREFCVYLETKEHKSKTTVVCKYHAVVKSFYSYNNVPLRLKTPRHAMKEREPHTVEQLKALMQVADVRERAFMMLLKDSGMSREDIAILKYGDIQSEYEENKEVIHFKVIRQKESVQYDTFIGKNAIEALKAYLNYRQRRGEKITRESPLMATLDGKPMTDTNLSQIFMRLSEKVGFATSPHRFRKFFESHMGLAAPSIVVKYWMGHSLGVEKHYFIPPLEKQREKYAEGYKEIDLFRTEINAIELRKQSIKDNARFLLDNGQITQEHYERMINPLALCNSMEDIDQHLENITSYGRPTKDKDCRNGNCQKIVEEKELSSYIEQGWKFVSVLPSGKVVITNE